MSAILFAANKYYLTQNITATICSAPFLVVTKRGMDSLSRLPKQTRERYQSNEFFLLWIFISQLLQFINAFIYTFSFTEYLVRFILILQIYAINNFMFNSLSTSFAHRWTFSFLLRLLFAFNVIFLFVSLLSITSENNCDQINVRQFVAYLFVFGVYSIILGVGNIQQTNHEVQQLETELLLADSDSFYEIEYKIKKNYGRKSIFFFKNVLGVVFLNCFCYSGFLFWKFRGYEESCLRLFANYDFLLLVSVCACEFFMKNSVSIFLFFIYYWNVREMIQAEAQLVKIDKGKSLDRIYEED